MAAGTNKPLLSVRDLVVEFETDQGVLRAVDGVSFDIHAGETLGLVGESGCGKTVTGLSILGLVPSPPGRIVSGRILLEGSDLAGMDEVGLRKIRGSKVSMIFQEPMTALNPVFRIGNQMRDVLQRHQGLTRLQAHSAAIEILAKVGIPEPAVRVEDYPHQLSGGMRQRVMIAMALSCGPKLLVADEPTTALDVTTQAQVLEQIVRLQQEFGMAMLLVTHDLGVVAETCRHAVVMYCGRIVESSSIDELFARPRHPYTTGLLASIPRATEERGDELPVIPGMVPDLLHLPRGCAFADRCPKAHERCRQSVPHLDLLQSTRTSVACYEPNA
ncbi:MAG: ABC transporter ATP-binding protein [Gammaproteobacteria bacterium]|jgi:oligopeptide/dipeptide ABC transporter ATP-binding protein|nr:ABC transporter ATP-binding protein [Gammaproteobacteria bacterium]MDP6616842.1 ABC transporter ATP-binding protein [Gammaproteobacteria bacterium]MDP6694598.1 ABC transporter ATP-binding protein [Gammaproteobacteria bacterium]